MTKLAQVLEKINQIEKQQSLIRRKLLDVDELLSEIEKIFNLPIKAGDLITAIKLAQNTVNVLEMAKEFEEEETQQ